MDPFEQIEDVDGVRMSWNMWPGTRTEAARLVVPVGMIYTPLKHRVDLLTVGYEPVMCKCRGILNPYCQIDSRARMWTCPFCLQRNGIPSHYDIGQPSLPPELQLGTMEYVLSKGAATPPIFLFLLDTCVEKEELEAQKNSLLELMTTMPQECMVGVITYGMMVQVHEIASECPKAYVFRGTKRYESKQIQEILNLGFKQPKGIIKFVQPLSQCEFAITTIIEAISMDPWPVGAQMRPKRCTGVALAVAIGILETFANTGARIILFSGGPCTEGPGMVVGPELKDMMRSHNDLEKDQAQYYKKAAKYYFELAKKAANNSHAIDIFAASLEQVGTYEMRSLPGLTGGTIIQSDGFDTQIFRQSLQKLFQTDTNDQLTMGFNAHFEVMTSRDLKVSGLIGHAISQQKTTGKIAEQEVGIGGTCAWKISGISPRTSVSLFFEMANVPSGQNGLIQFQTIYQHSSGQYRCKVTTLARNISQGQDFTPTFDQEAAAVLMARLAVVKDDNAADVLRWLDRMLIRVCQRFAQYCKDDPSTFNLSQSFSLYPQFMFHLRRSQFLQVFNNSPDESAYYRHIFLQEDCYNSLVMIQPTLTAYVIDNEPVPVLLDSCSVNPDCILLLDTFFHIVIHTGEQIAKWVQMNYHLMPEYHNIEKLVSKPREDAKNIIQDRFPVPRYIECDQNTSQSRFLTAKLNPSTTYTSMQFGQQQGYAIFTDDVSLQVFLDHLKKLSVAAN